MKDLKIYKCEICGAIVMRLNDINQPLNCCHKEMTLINVNTTEGIGEKHIPIVESNKKNVVVKVGSVPHIMENNHYIEGIGAFNDNTWVIKGLKPGDKPLATLNVNPKEFEIYEYCNLHGLGKAND